ncbi:MAG: hypothetical protein IJQ39_14175 [Thermoguttaceae bacterium]|nr:hypothetical protein [Thermoguttaceae bacterium]
MGYYQANPPVVNVWGQTAYPQQSTTYGDLVKGIPTINSNVSAVKAKTDNLPASPAATGDAMTLTSAYDAAKTASQLTSADLPSDYAKPGDAMTLTSAYDAAKTASQLTASDLPSDYAKPGDAMTLTSAYDAAKTASQLTASDLPSDYAKPGDAMTLTAAYDAAKTASQLTASDLSGLSTFDPSTDTVLIDATQAAGMATATGFATPSDIPTDYAKASDIPTSDISAIKAKTDNLPASPAATGDIPTSKINSVYAGLYNWRLQNNGAVEKITAKDASGNTLAQSTITRDNDGNIIRMDEETE